MKRSILLVLALAASAALVACGSDSGSDSSSSDGGGDQFSTAGFQEAVDAVSGEAGDDAPILQIQINTAGTQFQIRDGEQATGFTYSDGDLNSVDVEIVGSGSLQGQDFPLTEADPAAIDRIVAGVRDESGIEEIEITVMTLEKQILDGELKWVINAEGDGRTGLVYNADHDGSNVTSPTGSLPDAGEGGADATGGVDSGSGSDSGSGGTGSSDADAAVQDAQAVAECIQQAGSDVDAIQACTQ